MNIIHKPVFNFEDVNKHYGPCKYICTTEIKGNNSPCDVFFLTEGPHPEFGNKYFYLKKHISGASYIGNADCVESEDFALNCIADEKGNWHYSQYRHDYNDVGTGAIDGGRSYTKIVGSQVGFPQTATFIVRGGEFIQI